MILVSVGTQFPFDRLVRAVDEWAARNGTKDVVAQTGNTSLRPAALQAFPFLNPADFSDLQKKAAFHVAHAGMGSILTALELGKPIIIMPRDHLLGEHRNGHQLATAKCFANTPGVYVAMDENELIARLDNLNTMSATVSISPTASTQLVERITDFIAHEEQRRVGWHSFLPSFFRK